MAQSLEVNIKATSDVPQAVDKAKAAISGFDKQIEGIGKKFAGSFKDIFLSFLGPMAILTTVLAFIGKMIADNQKKSEDANRAAIDGTNALMSAEDRYYANKRNNEKKVKAQVEEAKVSREDITQEFLRNDPRGQAIVNKYQLPPMFPTVRGAITGKEQGVDNSGMLSKSKSIQDQVQALISEDLKNNPLSPTGPSSFKSPEGFGNVVGVGANPVMEAMTMQLEEARKQTALLESLNNKQPGGGVPVDFTKTPATNTPAISGRK